MGIPDSTFQISDGGADAGHVAQTIEQLREAERDVVEKLQSARWALEDAHAEIAELRRQVAENHIEFFSSRQLAELLQVSEDTIARLRKARKIPYIRVAARVYRWSSPQVIQIARLLEVRVPDKKPLRKAA